MRALTIRQPWASLIAAGTKTIETRGWKTSYRGDLLVHAGLRRDHDAFKVLVEAGYNAHQSLLAASSNLLPVGAVVAVATLADVVPIVGSDRQWMSDARAIGRTAAGELWEFNPLADDDLPWVDHTPDLALGDFTPGRYAWLLTDVRPLTPVPAKGRQGLWSPDADLVAAMPA